jgi:prevent-host-death family protein
MWSVAEAKAKLSRILERARGGEPQIIGARGPCVVLSMDEYQRLKSLDDKPHFGRWLVENLRGLGEIELPPRDTGRASPFADWKDEDFGA